LEELAYESSEKQYGKDDSGPYDCLRQACNEALSVVKKISTAMENGEYDFDGTKQSKAAAPVVSRANAVKKEFADIDNIRIKLENRDEDVKELKRSLKLKQEEMSEYQIRIGLLEKKLENAGKDSDDRVEKMQHKLDEATIQLKKKEKEFEETMDALQGDIDSLESEKAELKEKLKMLSKRTIIEGMTRQTSQAGVVPGSSNVLSQNVAAVGDSPMLLQQICNLKEALKSIKGENCRLHSSRLREQIKRLPPLIVPKKPTGLVSQTGSIKIGDTSVQDATPSSMKSLSKNTNTLLEELYQLSSCPKVVDISKRKPGAETTVQSHPLHQLVDKTAVLSTMHRSVSELQVQITSLLAANRTGGQIRTDFSAFPTPAFAKVLHEKSVDSQCIGVISIPTNQGKGATIPMHVGPQQLKQLHSRFVA